MVAARGSNWPFPAVQAMKFIRGRPTATSDPLLPFEVLHLTVRYSYRKRTTLK